MRSFCQRMAMFLSLLFFMVVAPASFADQSTLLAAAETAVSTEARHTVNINTADADTLARHLHGIGAAKAKAIVEYREKHGPFTSAEDLTNVKGIGQAILEKNAGIIVTE